jgi:hypothetical protein
MTVAGSSKYRVITIPHPEGHEEQIQNALDAFKSAHKNGKETVGRSSGYRTPGSTPEDGYAFSTRKTPLVVFKQHGLDMTLRGLKVSSYSGYGNRVSPQWWDEDYEGIKTAKCEGGQNHESVPYPGCGCGWWGTISPSGAQNNGYRQGQLLFRVKLFGVVEERQNGYRGQFMEVDKIFGPAHCIFCKNQKYNMVIKRDSVFNTQSGPGELVPMCNDHGPSEKATSYIRLSQDDISGVLGVEYLSGEQIPQNQRK